uniref:Uncharacterized protein n=1 Tax=Anguilla anguilla TaxID=7936 RepID=A0A0E9V9T7_ANGAN
MLSSWLYLLDAQCSAAVTEKHYEGTTDKWMCERH